MEDLSDKIQTAGRDINNVNGPQYIFNNPIMRLTGREGNFNEGELKILELEKDDYLKELNKQLAEKNLIERNWVIKDIQNILDEKNQVIIYGNPGVGKTVIMNELVIDRDAVYISIKGKSIDRVIRYLVNSCGLPYDGDREGIIDLFEGFLKSSSKYFLIDDCESNPELITTLLSIEKFDNKFVYASRNKNIAVEYQIDSYEISTFDEGEILEFLKVNEIKVDDLVLTDLIVASQGNPLYLYYFTKHQIKPLPKGLVEYQSAIWRLLSVDHKEILSCVAISTFPITLITLRDSYKLITKKDCSPMAFLELLSELNYLLKRNDSTYEIFHLSFKEFLLDEITDKGIADLYKREIGNACFNNNEIVNASVLLIDVKDKKIKPYLFESAHILYHSGYIDLSQKLLLAALEFYDTNDELYEIGYAHYHLSNIYKDFSNNSLAYSHIEEAQKIFEDLGEKKLLSAALTFKALFLAEDGQKKESFEIVDQIIDNLPEDKQQQALAYVNISKIYLCFNQYKAGAEFARKALEIFIELKDSFGIQISILNYSGCLANIEEEELATKYLEDMLNSENIEISPQVRAGILNNLTSCYRKSGDYDKAKQNCIEAIKIVRQLGLNNKVAMNLLNLGNVYRDEKNYEKCETIYKQGLKIAKEHNCKKEIGRAFELIANIYNLQKKYPEAKDAAINAIKISSLVKDDFRIAEAYIEKANANKGLGLIDEYVDDLINAVKHYLQENFYDEAIYHLFNVCNIANENKFTTIIHESIELLKEVVDKTNQIDIGEFVNKLKERNEIIDNSSALEIIEKMLQKYLLDVNAVNTVYPFIYYITLCKREFDRGGIDRFKIMLLSIQENIRNNSNLLNLLAVLIEQSNYLLKLNEVEDIIEILVDSIDGFYYREISDGSGIFTICWDNNVIFQVLSTKQDLTEFKIALSISLILKSSEQYIKSKIENFHEEFLEIYVFNYDTFNREIQEIGEKAISEPISAIFGERVGYDIPVPIILCKNYNERSDFAINDNNKAFVWILMNLYRVLISHFCHIPANEFDKKYAKDASKFAKTIMFPKANKENEDFWKIDCSFKLINVFSGFNKHKMGN
ncbi:MAG: hypothetical protein PWQ59_1310 [Thermoanaerobacterium sp.]|jgi:tetratricopeptide (TPR) repeat protein|nr:hypothetical protein [Thermoanaerobacterium sp.]MDK2801139.1 hypothetical protein [Clostridiales bacterium]